MAWGVVVSGLSDLEVVRELQMGKDIVLESKVNRD